LAFGLSPHVICIATLVGGITGVFIAAFLGDKIKIFLARFKRIKPENDVFVATKPLGAKAKIMRALWDKYGVFGVGFIGTLLLGAPISIGIGYGFGVPAKQLVKLCLIAVVIRSVLYSYFFDFIKNLF
jgi:hypothetical protein